MAIVGLAAGLIAVTALSGADLGATPLSGTGANVTWTAGSAGSSSSNGTFACGVSATVSMAAGDYNSGVGFVFDWSASAATSGAFSGGVTPSSSTAVLARNAGNAGTIAFGAEIVDPVVLVAFIDPGAAMDFGPNPITVLSYHSSVPGTPTIVGNKISLDGPVVDTGDDGWAVQVTGHFGPTSGTMPITVYSTAGETFGISVASPTICPPPTTTIPLPAPPGRPGPPNVTPGPNALAVAVVPPTTGGTPESYLVTAGPGGRTCAVTGASGSCTIEGLSAEQAYTVTVVASNAGGDSPPSDASAPVSPLTPDPGSSTPTTAVATASNGLPETGADVAPFTDAGLALVAFGSGTAALALRRRRIDHDDVG